MTLDEHLEGAPIAGTGPLDECGITATLVSEEGHGRAEGTGFRRLPAVRAAVAPGLDRKPLPSGSAMRVEELAYDLPAELVAQTPVEPRDAARLLVVPRDGPFGHRRFAEIVDLIEPSDVVVVNDTRVRPARIFGRRPSGGRVELLVLSPEADGTWMALARPARKLPAGARIDLGDGAGAVVRENLGEGRVRLDVDAPGGLEALLERRGEMPLPPYIHEHLHHPDRYQTVYARSTGSAAAPTAGLHFTSELLAAVAAKATLVRVELQVGLDTFRPVVVDDLAAHPMHSERYSVAEESRALLDSAAAEGRRIVAVGTTTVRVLETIADPARPATGQTALLIEPGHRFRRAGAIVTNFHLPRSTLLALVMAFGGTDRVRAAYAEAIDRRYRFYSFGDAMMLT